MKAVVFEAENKVAFRDIQMPLPGPGEVQVRTLVSVISAGTEGWVLANDFTWQATQYPCVPGYQRVGVVEKAGEGVEDWKPGDKAACTWGVWEGEVASQWGSHAALANTPAGELYAIPPGVADVDAASMVVAQVGFNAASRISLNRGDWVWVYGDGLIGQFAAQSAKARGAKVALIGHRQERLDLGRQAGLDLCINRRTQPVAELENRPAAVIDTIQTVACQREYQDLLEHGRGQVVYSGFTPGEAWADMGQLQMRELTTHFVSGWSRARNEATLGLMASGGLAPSLLITHSVPASRAPEMYDLIARKAQGPLGIALDWSGE